MDPCCNYWNHHSLTVSSCCRDKFEVTPQSVPYLAALVSVSEEVRSRCHLKHRLAQTISESTSSDSISNELTAQHSPHGPHGGTTSPQVPHISTSAATAPVSPSQAHPQMVLGVPPIGLPPPSPVTSGGTSPVSLQVQGQGQAQGQAAGTLPAVTTPTTRRQKSWDALDQNALATARLQKPNHLTQVQVGNEVSS